MLTAFGMTFGILIAITLWADEKLPMHERDREFIGFVGGVSFIGLCAVLAVVGVRFLSALPARCG